VLFRSGNTSPRDDRAVAFCHGDHRLGKTNDMLKNIILALLVLVYLGYGFALAQEKTQSISSKSLGSFTIHILDENWDSLRLGYTLEKSWPLLQSAYKQMTLLKVTEEDILKYDWVKQQIILTAETTETLKNTFRINANEPSSDGLIISLRAFVVTIDGQPAYGGIFLPRGSQMAIRYPVIYIGKDSNGLITMDIRPAHSIFDMESSDPAWNMVRKNCIRDVFARIGKLAP
jgi:hypothetical protein